MKKIVRSTPLSPTKQPKFGSTPLSPTKQPKFVIHKSGPHSFFELLTSKEEIVLHSELHRWRGAAEDAVGAVKKNAPDDACYQRRKSGTKQHYFVLTAPTGEVLGTSAMHETAQALDKAIAGAKRDVKKAEIEK